MRFLVPIDGSGFALNAAEYAGKMAAKLEADSVDFIYVIVHESDFMNSAIAISDVGEKIGNEALDDAIAAFKKYSDVPTGRFVEFGRSAANIIVDKAEKEAYDAIILSSKGKSNLERFLMGSVSTKIVHHAPCTVMLVR
ncbi:MAG: universal stress protein [Anaerovoracaceae bacterium]